MSDPNFNAEAWMRQHWADLTAALLDWKPILDERYNFDLIDDLTEEGTLHPGDMEATNE